MTGKRFVVLIATGLLMMWFGILGINVLLELRYLSTASNDNMQWTILQVETEIANLNAVLSDQIAAEQPDIGVVRLRADIALSRVALIDSGRTGQAFVEDPETARLRQGLEVFSDRAIEILDNSGELGRTQLLELRALTHEIRPDVRQLALLGLERGVERSEAQREEFARQLRLTGISAIALIIGLTVLLLILDRMLARARERDAQLLASSDRLTSTVAASLDAIVTSNEQGEIVDFNASAETIFGWSRADILGQKMEDTIVPHRYRAAHAAGMERYLTTGTPRVVDGGRVELSGLRKSGEEFPIELNITSAQGNHGELFIAYLRDISDRKIAEQKLIDARDRAERMDRAKSQFLAVMSHEMRTPLNGILGVLDLMRTTDLTSRQERYVRVASASGEILLEHVNEALDITRIEIGTMKLAPSPFNLDVVVQSIVDVLTPLAHEKNLSLNLQFDPGMARPFLADGGRIGQILTNLIGNAIKFTNSGSITVAVGGVHGADMTAASISVTDTGAGIPPESLEDIFEDFVALTHAEGRQSRGDGLGLSISRKIARLMGGDLTVQSVVGQGSSFTLSLSLERSTAEDIQATHDDGTGGVIIDPPSAQQVLIVEDNAINRSVLRDMLEGLGHKVTEACDGAEGVEAAQKRRVDLIIMDINMPVMDGIEAVRRIREMAGPNQRTYVLGLTAHGREEYLAKAEAAGMDGFCTKPIRLYALQDILAGIGGAEASSAGDIVADSEQIDSATLTELVGALGAEKTTATVDRFFEELETTLARLVGLTVGADAEDISAETHKLRGSAALLGLTALVAEVDLIAAASKQGVAPAYADGIESLRQMAAESRDLIRQKIANIAQADL
ncbi:response regulator [Rhodophyticola sp. CCM32]|uniref:hybrid sensor histidine kinase/response regulator n=1 Tax=Rhodophyticola sp. CCM32 TaxID=2916397 RepID=UPI00107FA45C|nr:response regulator [Rhodophyticola sp. CCM32]QBX99705.1 response regulator [Rhodophyticola sp. CCM32]